MHVPVLKEKVLEYLDPQPNQHFIDATLGFGGHTLAILEKTGPKGKVLAIEWDEASLEEAKKAIPEELQKRIVFVQDNFAHLADIVKNAKFPKISGILFDLGMSSWQLAKSERGFSFQKNEMLDMRFDPANVLDAKKILNLWSRQDIEAVLKEYGEERFARDIAKAIVEARKEKPIMRTAQLVEIVIKATPSWYHSKRISPATKTFQALRIAVNNELENIKTVLEQAISILNPQAKIAIISFHSLEDKIVKNFFKQSSNLTILTKKPILPSFDEQKANPRSRSARLRVAVKKEETKYEESN